MAKDLFIEGYDYINDIEYRWIYRIKNVKKNQYYPEGIKYSMVLLKNNIRVLGYDNHEQQGHHKHQKNMFIKINHFCNIKNLMKNFRKEVEDFLHEENNKQRN